MRRSEVEADEEPANLSETPWAYISSISDTSRRLESAKSSSIFSVLCSCFSNESNNRSDSDVSVNFAEEDPPVTLSQALLCLDNPQMPSDQVSFPITEELILANHRCQNVLQQPCVTKSTQMFFMGYDAASLRTFHLSQDSPSEETMLKIGSYTKKD